MEGIASARVAAHRLQKMIAMGEKLVGSSEHKEHLYQLAGDLIVGIPGQLDRLIRDLDRASYAMAKIGEDHLKDRLPIEDRAQVEDGTANSKPWGGGKTRTSERVARRWEARQKASGGD